MEEKLGIDIPHNLFLGEGQGLDDDSDGDFFSVPNIDVSREMDGHLPMQNRVKIYDTKRSRQRDLAHVCVGLDAAMCVLTLVSQVTLVLLFLHYYRDTVLSLFTLLFSALPVLFSFTLAPAHLFSLLVYTRIVVRRPAMLLAFLLSALFVFLPLCLFVYRVSSSIRYIKNTMADEIGRAASVQDLGALGPGVATLISACSTVCRGTDIVSLVFVSLLFFLLHLLLSFLPLNGVLGMLALTKRLAILFGVAHVAGVLLVYVISRALGSNGLPSLSREDGSAGAAASEICAATGNRIFLFFVLFAIITILPLVQMANSCANTLQNGRSNSTKRDKRHIVLAITFMAVMLVLVLCTAVYLQICAESVSSVIGRYFVESGAECKASAFWKGRGDGRRCVVGNIST